MGGPGSGPRKRGLGSAPKKLTPPSQFGTVGSGFKKMTSRQRFGKAGASALSRLRKGLD